MADVTTVEMVEEALPAAEQHRPAGVIG